LAVRLRSRPGLTFLAFLLFLCSCASAQTTVNYQPTTEDFVNPERGFYHYTETRASNPTPLDPADIANLRASTTVSGANHAVVSSLIFRYFFLDDFTAGPISQAFLNQITADFAATRQAGMKIIPRFAYTNAVNGSGCASFICPPYGDAPKAIVLNHITQLGPLLQANADVIAVVQMGFIGTWGENYYTDYFGDASPEGGVGRLLDVNWTDRIEVLNALLAAVPASRSVQVRYPQMKQRAVYGINAPTTSAALTAAEAYSGTSKARIGLHNDCLLASAYDYGTYEDYGNSSGFGSSDSTNLKPYFAADSRFVPVGGETCDDSSYDPTNNCASAGGIGDTELRRMHYSYLNVDFNHDVNNDWQDGGCMDDIKRGLGYRFELQSGTYPDALAQGETGTFAFSLINQGYTAPYNERRVEMILRNVATSQVWLAQLTDDPRLWDRETAQHTVSAQLCIPGRMPAGTYDLLLNLPAPEASLYELPDYSIRVANKLGGVEVWEAATGYNDLGHQIVVTAGGGACAGDTEFVSLLALPVTFSSISTSAMEKSVEVQWWTSEETDNDYFVVERSNDGGAFVALGRVAPNNDFVYQFLDEEVSADTDYYYRIRQVNYDGSSQLSRAIHASIESGKELKVYPNPTSGVFRIGRDYGALMIYDKVGRRVAFQRNWERISLIDAKAGVYYLVLVPEDGGEVAFGRVVVF
jgi:hypothetical protein